MEFRVPQGSLPGPGLFSININNLTDYVAKGELVMFADETMIF